MPVTRMRMRSWLEKMIESNSITGLTWVDKDKKMFSIPWKHAARHGWELDKEACLFKQWAIHTGNYVEGQTCDPKTWKANFRCAMNSLPDVEEVKDESINQGHQAVRVFRMLPVTQKSRDKRSKAKDLKMKKLVKMEEEDSDTPLDEVRSDTVESTVNIDQDFTYVPSSEVPDMASSVEIGTSGLLNSFCHRFEVSPEHSSDYDYIDDIIQICQQLEKDSTWMTSSLDHTGFLSNDVCTSPASQWSENSSVDDLDDIPQYTASDITAPTDDLWNSFYQQISF